MFWWNLQQPISCHRHIRNRFIILEKNVERVFIWTGSLRADLLPTVRHPQRIKKSLEAIVNVAIFHEDPTRLFSPSEQHIDTASQMPFISRKRQEAKPVQLSIRQPLYTALYRLFLSAGFAVNLPRFNEAVGQYLATQFMVFMAKTAQLRMKLTANLELVGDITVTLQYPLIDQAKFHNILPLDWRSTIGLDYLSDRAIRSGNSARSHSV